MDDDSSRNRQKHTTETQRSRAATKTLPLINTDKALIHTDEKKEKLTADLRG
jgi:hypothetical protein